MVHNAVTDYDCDRAKGELSAGLLKLLQPVVEQCDARAKMVLESQAQLAQQIDLFTAGLFYMICSREHSFMLCNSFKLGDVDFSEISKIQDIKTPQLAQYADKLNASRKKLKRVDTLVMQTKERVANIARMHNQLLESERKFLERETPAAPKEGGATAETPAAPAPAGEAAPSPAAEAEAPPAAEAEAPKPDGE
jgi:hypothetical protein